MPGKPKGMPKSGGRTKGTPNRATSQAREAITAFIDNHSEHLEDWLEEIREKNGAKAAMDSFIALAEFAVPKLARTELTGPDGGAIPVAVDRWYRRDEPNPPTE